MTGWMARDPDGSLWLYKKKPVKADNGVFMSENGKHPIQVDKTAFREKVTKFNSPVKVKIKFDV